MRSRFLSSHQSPIPLSPSFFLSLRVKLLPSIVHFSFFVPQPSLPAPLLLSLSPSLQLSKWSVLSRYMLFLVEDRSRAWSRALWEQDLTNLFEGVEWISPKQTSSVFYQSFLNPTRGDITQLLSQSTLRYILSYKSHHWAVDVQQIQGKYRWLRLRPVCARGPGFTEPTQGRCLALGKSKVYKGLLWNKTYPLIVSQRLESWESSCSLFYFQFMKRHFGDRKSWTSQPSPATNLWWIV